MCDINLFVIMCVFRMLSRFTFSRSTESRIGVFTHISFSCGFWRA